MLASNMLNTPAQPAAAEAHQDNRLVRIRQLGHLSIYTDSQTGQFLLLDDTSNVHFLFDDVMQANRAAMRAHQEAIDNNNRRFFEVAEQTPACFTH